MAKDYYDILGVGRSASKEEIKKAFHRLAHKFHPDKQGGDEAKFKEVNEAYQTLSDDGRRAQYDKFGGFDFSGQGQPGGWDFSQFSGANGFQFDLGDLFSDFFNAAGGRASRRTRRGRDISVDIQIPFAEAVFGTERQVLINKISQCETCGGSGARPGTKLKSCVTCAGRGQVNENRQSILGSFTTLRECGQCRGRGEVPAEECIACGGHGVLKKAEEILITIPAGIQAGEMIRLAGRGEALGGGVAGDLYVRVHVEAHPIFRRDGLNLLMDLPVKLTEAILGTEHKIQTLDGEVKVSIPAGVNHGEILRVRGRGVPGRQGKRGDLLVKVLIKTPAKLSKRARELIEDLQKEGL